MPISEKTRKAAMEAFTAIEKYDRERFSHGPDRVYLYYSDVDGDWLNELDTKNQVNTEIPIQYEHNHGQPLPHH